MLSSCLTNAALLNSDALIARLGLAPESGDIAVREETIMHCRAHLDQETYELHYRQGETADTHEIVDRVLTELAQ